MKTQLLEDIGESAALPLTPSQTAGYSKAGKEAQKLAPAGNAEPARPRSALGVWRQKPAGEAAVSTIQPPDQQPTPLDLHNVFEEIAALEAQYVPPARQHEPAVAPAEPRHALPAAPAQPLHKPAVPPAEPTLAPNPAQSAAPPQDPLFDFTPPSPGLRAADPFTPASAGSRQRYLLWAACVLSGALLIQGGRWLYQERSDARSLALLAGEAKQNPRVDNVERRQANAVREPTPVPDVDVRAAPAVPPLVMLEPDPPAAARLEQPSEPEAGRVEPRTSPKPEPVAARGLASPSPEASSRKPREQSGAAARPATKRSEREPVRQFARASAVGTDKAAERDTGMAATLKACREHGYHAAQCIKRACSVTKHGFVCRGR